MDRTHPSDSGREKVAKLLLDFLKNSPTSKTWFLASKYPTYGVLGSP